LFKRFLREKEDDNGKVSKNDARMAMEWGFGGFSTITDD
jgi:hypothetical protein